MNYYIGIDIGTSATKSILFDCSGCIISSSSYEYDIISLKPGYAEENPLDWVKAVKYTLKEITKKVEKNDIKGIGLSGQMHGLVILDNDDRVLDNAIIWCDNRTSLEKDEIASFGQKRLKEITGNEAMPAFTLAKLLWIRNNKKDIYDKIDKIMLPKDYIRYVLTKEFKTEYSDASGMQMMDLKSEEWSDEIINYFKIDKRILPKIIPSNEISGYLSKEIANELNLSTECFVVGGAGDQAAGALGNGIISSGDTSISLGSSGVVFKAFNNLDIKEGPSQYFHHAIKGVYHTMAVTNGCGNSLKWYRDYMCKYENELAKKEGISTYDFITKNLDDIPAGTNGLLYLPYILGERCPNLAPNATGLFIGLRSNTTKDMMTKALIEGITYSIRDCFLMDDFKSDKIILSGGGAKNPKWCQIVSSVLNNKIVKTTILEAPALGVAILAMVAGGEYKNEEEACKKIIKYNEEYNPIDSDVLIYNKYFEIYKKLYIQNKIIFDMNERVK